MKKKILVLLCVVLLLSCVLFSVVAMASDSKDGNVKELYSLSSSSQKAAVAAAYLYKDAHEIVLSVPYATVNLTQIAIMKIHSDERADALTYLNDRKNRQVELLYNSMADVGSRFDDVVDEYGYYSDSCKSLKNAFSSLKSDAKKLIDATMELISGSSSSYSSLYDSYESRLSNLLSEYEDCLELTQKGFEDCIDDIGGLSNSDQLKIDVACVYKEAGDLLVTLPYASIQLTQTALMQVFAGEKATGLSFLNKRADRQLQSAYNLMDKAVEDFISIEKEFELSSGSSYASKRKELEKSFSSLRSASTELVRRTRALINGVDSGYDSYYTAYCEQLSVLSQKYDSYSDTFQNEFDALISSLLGSDFDLVG